MDSAFTIMGQSLSSSSGGRIGNALSAAAHFGHMNIVQLLIDLGADVNMRSGRLGCALSAAAHSGETDVVDLLIDLGADVNMRSGEFGSALASVTTFGGKSTSRVVEQLLHRGATVDKDLLRGVLSRQRPQKYLKRLLDGYGRLSADELSEFLFIAAAKSKPENIELLGRLGADSGKRDKDGNTALHIAAGTQSPQPHRTHTSTEALIVIGAKVNAIGGECGTALIAASAIGNADAVRTLLKHGADPCYRGKIHGTAIEAACKGRRDAGESRSQTGGKNRKSQFDKTVRLLSEAGLEDKSGNLMQNEATVLES